MIRQGWFPQEELKVADVRVQGLDKLPLLPIREGPGTLQGFPLQEGVQPPDPGVAEAQKLQPATLHQSEEPLQGVAGFLGMEIHVGKGRIIDRIQVPTPLMALPDAVVFRQLGNELAGEPDPRSVCLDAQQSQSVLGPVNLPAASVCIEEQVQDAPVRQGPGQCRKASGGIRHVMQNTDGVDELKPPQGRSLQQTDAVKADALLAAGAPQALLGHGQGLGADVQGGHPGFGIEMHQVITAHTGATTGIQNVEGLAGIGCPTGAVAIGSGVAPAPVVTRWRTVLQGIWRIGERVVEVTHPGRGPISHGHGVRRLRHQQVSTGNHLRAPPALQTFVHPSPDSPQRQRSVLAQKV